MKKISFILLPFLLSCSLNNNLNTSSIKKSFNLKGFFLTQENELTYKGTWNTVNSNNYSGSSIVESNEVVENNSSSLVYTGSWTNFSNGSASASSFHYTNSETPFQMANDTSSFVTYTRPNWLTYSAFTYNDVTISSIYRVTNQETDINKIKYIYPPTNTVEAWSSNMQYWSTYWNMTYSGYASAILEIPFSGTNIQIYQNKSSMEGICKIEVFDENNNLERSIEVDNYNPTTKLSKTVIAGLKNGNHKVVISRTGNKNPNSSGYRFNFVRAEVLPSIVYNFTGNNIIYNAFTANNCGKVAVTIDNNPSTTEIIDLYNPSNIYQDIYTKRDLGSGQHTITIDALGEKHLSSSGNRINVNEFKARPAVRGTFSGTYLDLKLVKLSNYGKADLYIDGVWNQEIDLYNSSTQFFDLELDGLSNTNHSFYIEAKNTRNPLSSGNRISFDGFNTNKAEYNFQGVSLSYYAKKGPDQGMVDIYIDNNYQGRFDLYSSTEQYQQGIFNITGLSNTVHTFKLIPSGRKRWWSSNYKVNLDYFQINTTPRVVYSGYDGTTYHIYVSPEDGSSSPLQVSDSSANTGSPAIAGNGNQVVWTRFDGTNYEVKVGSATNSFSPYIIDTTPAIPNPKISKDGSKVVWIKRVSGDDKIYVRNSDNSNSPILISGSVTSNYSPIFSPDGNKVVWVGSSKIYSADSDGSGTPINISTTTSININPTISNDNSKVVWKGRNGTNYNIYVGNIDGSGTPIQISTKTSNVVSSYPRFSNDGSKVVYEGLSSGQYHIFVANSDGSGGETQLSTTTTENRFPAFSPDGTKVLWQGRESGIFHIFVRNADGSGNVTKISDLSTNNFYHSFSPDGSKIVWQGTLSGVNHIFVRNSDGSGPITQLTTTTIDNAKPLYEGLPNIY